MQKIMEIHSRGQGELNSVSVGSFGVLNPDRIYVNDVDLYQMVLAYRTLNSVLKLAHKHGLLENPEFIKHLNEVVVERDI